jgi:hypothetical protein
VTLRYIRELEKILENDYLAIRRPYAEGHFGLDGARKQAFSETAQARRRNLRGEIEAFYANVLGRKDFRFEDVLEAVPKGKLGPAQEALLEEVRSLG